MPRPHDDERAVIRRELRRARGYLLALAAELSEEQAELPPRVFGAPAKWHLGHAGRPAACAAGEGRCRHQGSCAARGAGGVLTGDWPYSVFALG